MEITDRNIEIYSTLLSSAPSAECEKIYKFTEDNRDDAQMLIGPLEAGFLGLLAETLSAERILEIGCYTGYSALAMAEHLPEEGEVVTIDFDETVIEIARGFWSKSPHGKKITLHNGTALEVLKNVRGPFDLVFIDADKENYIEYLDSTLPMLSDRGIIVADNTLWYGKVLQENTEDIDAKAIRAFNEYVFKRKDLLVTLLPLRDGVSIIKKTG